MQKIRKPLILAGGGIAGVILVGLAVMYFSLRPVADGSRHVDFAVKVVAEGVNHMRELSPIWEMYKDGVDLTKIEWSAH